ncbi:MAG: hypothetical protein LH613_06420 [Chamaesiphon sp.]|nr:hypothetical protein [Chamaesiphon sp.]
MFTVNMYQSSTRNNFLDILLDPTAIAILASIALHATIGASLPFFTQPEKQGKKVGPSTVKVVQLTPSELQRIPQAPPAPTPQVLPPVTQPIPSTRPSVAPVRPPQFSTAPQTIPFSPIRGAFDGVTIKPPAGNKQQPATPKKPPIAPIFDPESIFKTTPKPSKPPIQKGITAKPSTQPTPLIKKPLAKKPQAVITPTPQPSAVTDDDGGEQQPTTPAPTPTKQAQQPAGTPQPSRPTVTPTPAPLTPPSDRSAGSGNSNFYGKYTKSATQRLQQYIAANPGLKLYQPKLLVQNYPVGVACSKVKQPPFIVLMVAFDKVPENQENNILGESTAPSIDKPYVAGDRDTPENRKLGELAANAALYDANKADQDRPAADKGNRVLYQYRVQFDPATCKK